MKNAISLPTKGHAYNSGPRALSWALKKWSFLALGGSGLEAIPIPHKKEEEAELDYIQRILDWGKEIQEQVEGEETNSPITVVDYQAQSLSWTGTFTRGRLFRVQLYKCTPDEPRESSWWNAGTYPSEGYWGPYIAVQIEWDTGTNKFSRYLGLPHELVMGAFEPGDWEIWT